MIVLDLDVTDGGSPDSGLSFRWNGIWTGPKPTQLLKAYIRGQERAFCFSFDADGQNRLFELKTSTGGDYGAGQTRKIKSYFISKRFDFSSTQVTNKFVRKRLTGGDVWVSEIEEEICMSVDYRPDSYQCWNELMPEQCAGCDECDVSCDFDFSEDRYKRWKFVSPKSVCQVGMDIETDQGAEFQFKVEIEGAATVDRMRFMANIGDNGDSPIGDCPDDSEPDCTPITCCPTDIFNFYQLIEP